MSTESLGRNGKTVVAVGALVLLTLSGTAGTVTADSPPAGTIMDQTPGEVEIVVVVLRDAESISIGAPNGNQSIKIYRGDLPSGTTFTVAETPENRTVSAENYFTTGATKTEEQTCWISHGGIELEDGIRVNESVDIPCDGGEIAGPQNLESIGRSGDAVLIEPGEKIEYQNGTYGVLVEVDGEKRVHTAFTVGSGGPSYEGPHTSNTLYAIIGIMAAVASLVMIFLLIAAVLWEGFTE
ncbi:MAG: hypothetical protein U5J64_09725 [Halobacteriales archaeon]|nr:hypothetical protein [Halobacteriales archaeon]